VIKMADLENRVDKLEDKVITLEQQISNVMTKVDMFVSEMRDFKVEMREQNKMRADEILNVEAKLDSKFDKLSSQIQSMAIATVVGVGAIVWAIRL